MPRAALPRRHSPGPTDSIAIWGLQVHQQYPKSFQARPDDERLWTMLQNYRLKGVIHYLAEIVKKHTRPALRLSSSLTEGFNRA